MTLTKLNSTTLNCFTFRYVNGSYFTYPNLKVETSSNLVVSIQKNNLRLNWKINDGYFKKTIAQVCRYSLYFSKDLTLQNSYKKPLKIYIF